MADIKNACIKIGAVKDIPIYLHWTAPAGGLLVSVIVGFDFPAVIYFCAAFAFTSLIHELGHAFAARRFDLKVYNIRLHGFGGFCQAEAPKSYASALAFSSAGLLAEALLLAATVGCFGVFGKPASTFGQCLVLTFIYVNGFTILMNLIPLKRHYNNFGSDGYLLLKLVANRIRGRSYSFPDISATFPRKTRLTTVGGFMPPDFQTGIEILNDNGTTMEFVASALTKHLNMSQDKAVAAMLEIHSKGGLLIPLSSYEMAVGAADAIGNDASANGFKLTCRPVMRWDHIPALNRLAKPDIAR